MRTKYLPVAEGARLGISKYPNFHKTGSIAGMRRLYYGAHDLLVRCGDYIYNVTSNPSIYYNAH